MPVPKFLTQSCVCVYQDIVAPGSTWLSAPKFANPSVSYIVKFNGICCAMLYVYNNAQWLRLLYTHKHMHIYIYIYIYIRTYICMCIMCKHVCLQKPKWLRFVCSDLRRVSVGRETCRCKTMPQCQTNQVPCTKQIHVALRENWRPNSKPKAV